MSETDYAPMNSEVEAPPPSAPEPAPPEPAPAKPAPARPPPLVPVATNEPPPTMETQETSDLFLKGVNEIIKRLSAIVANFEKGARRGAGNTRARAPAAAPAPAAPAAAAPAAAPARGTQGKSKRDPLTEEQEQTLITGVNNNANGMTDVPFSTIRDWFPDLKLTNDDIGMAFAFSNDWAIKNTNNKTRLQYAKDRPDIFSACHNTINQYRQKRYEAGKTTRTDMVPPPEPSNNTRATTTRAAAPPPPPPDPAPPAPEPESLFPGVTPISDAELNNATNNNNTTPDYEPVNFNDDSWLAGLNAEDDFGNFLI